MPVEPSPYLPTTRRFVSPLYLRVEDVPEMGRLEHAAHRQVLRLAAAARALNGVDRIDRDAAWPLKQEALRVLFDAGLTGQRAASFEAFCDREGEGLTTFATWCALGEAHGLPWTDWPAELHDPASPAVAAFRRAHADDVDFHRWLQWLLEQQLRATQQEARSAGMSLGIVQDLAVGVHPLGADAWGLGDAPRPRRDRGRARPTSSTSWARTGRSPRGAPTGSPTSATRPSATWSARCCATPAASGSTTSSGCSGCGGSRPGAPPPTGRTSTTTTRRCSASSSSRRSGPGRSSSARTSASSPRRPATTCSSAASSGTSILWFEWEGDTPEAAGALPRPLPVDRDDPRPAARRRATSRWRTSTSASELGLLTRPVAEERAHELASIAKLRDACVERGLLEPGADIDEVVEALHRWMALTPSRMLAVSLADVVGDLRAVNQPGTNDEYPNWRVPLSGPDGRVVSLEELKGAELAPLLFAALRGEA